MKTTITRTIVLLTIFILSLMTVQAATLTCQQTTSTSLEIPQFSSKNIEVKCTASGGTVSNVQINPNSDPGTGLAFTNSQTISSSISSGSSSTAKWSASGDSPNTYTVSYTISSDGTNAWSGASTTNVEVPSAPQLTVEYVLPPSIFTPTVEQLDYKINNIGGTTATNIKMALYRGETKVSDTIDYPSTDGIAAGGSAALQWTNETGFNESGTYTTKVYIGDTLHDEETVSVLTASGNITQNTGWNLVSLNRQPSDNSTSAVFGPYDSNLSIVWGMTSTGWQRYQPGGVDFIQEVSPIYAYWLKSTNSFDFEVTGTALSGATLDLSSGWNLRGFPSSSESLNINQTVQPIISELDILWGYNNTNGVWKRFNPTNYDPDSSSHLHTFNQGHAYWYKVNSEATLTVP